MWNRFSRYALWMLMGAVLVGLSSCKKEGESYRFGVSYGNIVGSADSYHIVTDEGTNLYVVEGASATEVVDGQRVMANYSIEDRVETGYNIRLNFLYNILTKDPVFLSKITWDERREIGDDPLNVRSMSFGGKYLNVNIEVMRKNPEVAHFINAVVDEQRSDDQTVYLTLTHNAYGDEASIPVAQWVSFDLSTLVPAGQQQINVYVEWTNYRGEECQDSGVFTLPSVSSDTSL